MVEQHGSMTPTPFARRAVVTLHDAVALLVVALERLAMFYIAVAAVVVT